MDREGNLMTDSLAADLIQEAGFVPKGPVPWGTRIPCGAPGVYVVEMPAAYKAAPLDQLAIQAWIERVPALRLDGGRPSAATLAKRLASFWIAFESVLYVGLAGTSVAKRVGQYYRTPLGNARPHAGGHWLKTLNGLDTLQVWWAEGESAALAEAALFKAFAERHGDGFVLPFANRQSAAGVRKPHGITGSTLSTPGPDDGRAGANRLNVDPSGTPSDSTVGRGSASSRIAKINAELQRVACHEPEEEISAVNAARALDRFGLLKDSVSRRGLPLRNLLRAGRIENAYQVGGTFWFIRCADDGR